MIELSQLIGEISLLFLKVSVMTLVFIFLVTLLDSWIDSKMSPSLKSSVKDLHDKSHESGSYEETHLSYR